MEVVIVKFLTFLLCLSLLQGWVVQSVPYDATASIECLSNPMKPLYNGGVIQNSEFNNGLMGWSVPWGVKAAVSSSPSGNKFAVATNAGAPPSRSVYQKITMEADHHYSLSAWLQVSSASTAEVRATFKTPDGKFIAGGSVVAKSGCWSMLKGGMTSSSSGPAEISFESSSGNVEIMVDSVSLQPFSFAEWNAQRRRTADVSRKSAVKLIARGPGGEPLSNATVKLDLVRPRFPFGNAMTREILSNPAYERWFTSRFTVATFENEMKWYATEWIPNHEDYRVPDAMVALASKHGIMVRGHNVVWENAESQLKWVLDLNPDQLRSAAEKRLKSVVSRYAGKVIGWDVVNENLHWSFFESKLGPDASSKIYHQASEVDQSATLFMNEFGTLEQPIDAMATASKYVAKMKQIRSYPGNSGLKLAVGLESHFGSTPNIPYMRATLDTLAQMDLPIWLTEIDVAGDGGKASQAKHLEEVLREGYGHPAVHGMVMWAAWHANGCYVMCLTDNEFNNLPVGDVVDRLIAEWKTHPGEATADMNGVVEVQQLVHGEYNFTVTHPSLPAPAVRTLTVDAAAVEHTLQIEVA